MTPPREYSGSFTTKMEVDVTVFWYYEDGEYLKPVIDEIQVDCWNSILQKSNHVSLDSIGFQYEFRKYLEDNLYDEVKKQVWETLEDAEVERYEDPSRVFEDYDWIKY